ncbi:MAG: glycosyltransferase family 1 protein, partial [bacterium]
MVIGIEAARANAKEKTGTEQYACSIITSMVALDHETDFFLYTDKPLTDPLAHLGPNVHEKILRWPPRRLWNQVRLSLAMLRKKPDVLFLPAHTIPLVHPAATVTMIHDVGFDRSPQLYAARELAYH